MDINPLSQYQLNWESRSSLRTRPRKIIDFSLPGYFFPIDKQVIFLIPEIDQLSNKNEILVLSFCKYLKDIVQLESKWIYAACHNIIYKKMPVDFSDRQKIDACTVIMDEYYHIYIAYDLLLQLRDFFPHFPDLDNDFSDSYHAMVTIKSRLDIKYHELFEILAVCIFETTLIRELVSYFDSETIHPSIKYYIKDHMNDEARHFGFFYALFCYIWEHLPEDYREAIGSQLGAFVKIYLNIQGEMKYNEAILAWILKDKSQAKIKIDKLYKGFEISPDIPIVKNVLNVLTKSGILEHKAVKKGFQESGLLG